jgi:hypothetical protein
MAQTKSRSSGSPSSGRRTSAARSGSSAASRTRQNQPSDGASRAQAATGGSGLSRAVVPVATAVVGAVAGMLAGQRRRKQRRKVLGVPIPGTGRGGLDGLTRSVGEAGKQLGRLADEVRTGREKAEEIGKALS